MSKLGQRLTAAMAETKRRRQAEFERLMPLPPAEELAAQLMPAFGPAGPKRGKPVTKRDLIDWLLRMHPLTFRERALCATELGGPVAEALQVLEHTELVYATRYAEAPDDWRATQRGLVQLADATYRRSISHRAATRAIDR